MFNGNHKNATIVGDTTTKDGAVSRVENGNICVRYGLTLFVDDGARQMAVCLVGTFHINLMFSTLDHTYRIKASQLYYGIGNRLVLQMSCHAEGFKFIVNKGDILAGMAFFDDMVAVVSFIP